MMDFCVKHKIVDWADYGVHIKLRCRDHHDVRYSTKNIAPIGARSLFHITGTPDCKCSGLLLEPVPQKVPMNTA